MTTISSNDFASRPDMYLDMAESSDVCIRKGRKTFHIVYVPAADEQPVLEPDDDLRRAVSAEDFREQLTVAMQRVDRKYARK